MGQVLILFVFYAICASAVLVWSTLREEGVDLNHQVPRPMVRRVAISDYLLLQWSEEVPDLVILDIHLDRGIGGWDELASHWLAVRLTNLPNLLKWLPAESMVVFCCREATEQLDTRSEIALVQAGIGTIYFLDESPIIQANLCCDRDSTGSDSNRELRKITMRETRRGL
jgi:hypothetical protein